MCFEKYKHVSFDFPTSNEFVCGRDQKFQITLCQVPLQKKPKNTKSDSG